MEVRNEALFRLPASPAGHAAGGLSPDPAVAAAAAAACCVSPTRVLMRRIGELPTAHVADVSASSVTVAPPTSHGDAAGVPAQAWPCFCRACDAA